MRTIKLYDLIKELLEKYPPLRDSDKKLIWNVWGTLGYLVGPAIPKENFMKAPAAETIRRTRQKIQETNIQLRSSQPVQEAKNVIANQKGTFIYREQIPLL